MRTAQTRPLKPISRHFASQPVVLNELSHMIDNQWKARSHVYNRLMCLPTLKFYSIRTKGHMQVIPLYDVCIAMILPSEVVAIMNLYTWFAQRISLLYAIIQ